MVPQVSQAEHGPGSPAWLVSTCPLLASRVAELVGKQEENWKKHGENWGKQGRIRGGRSNKICCQVPTLIAKLDHDVGGTPATKSWPDYGGSLVISYSYSCSCSGVFYFCCYFYSYPGEIVVVASKEEAVRLTDRSDCTPAKLCQTNYWVSQFYCRGCIGLVTSLLVILASGTSL